MAAKASVNPIAKVLVGFLFVGALWVVFGPSGEEPTKQASDGAGAGQDGGQGTEDSPKETLEAFTAELQTVRDELKAVRKQNKDLRQRLDRSDRVRPENEPAEAPAGEGGKSAAGDKEDSELAALRRRLDRLKDRMKGGGGAQKGARERRESAPPKSEEVPVGIGYRDNRPAAAGTGSDSGSATGAVGGWIKPMSGAAAGAAGPAATGGAAGAPRKTGRSVDSGRILDTAADGAEAARDTVEGAADRATGEDPDEEGLEPRYTLAENSVGIRSVAATAIVGRVPRGGTVHDTYEFRIVTRAKNLAANGFQIPELAGAIWRGVARGDQVFSCVRGDLISVTFIFHDGTIRTVRAEDQGEPLGKIADEWGNPCVSGTYVSNGEDYLTSRILGRVISIGGEAWSQEQTTTSTSAVGGTSQSAVTGDAGDHRMGQMIKAGGEEASDFFEQRMQDFYDAVFTRAGTKVTVLIDQEIHIDYDPNGRKIRHAVKTNQDPANATVALD